jgi:hypothetical protein
MRDFGSVLLFMATRTACTQSSAVSFYRRGNQGLRKRKNALG